MKEYLENVRKKSPIIHNITNYVTVNDCANIILACGASPIMADEEREITEITALCQGLNLNIGTLNERVLKSMLLAGKKARALSHPIVLDPVGVGASRFRTEAASQILEEVKPTVIRGNISEIKALAGLNAEVQGVDAGASDRVTEKNLEAMAVFARDFARRRNAVIVISGAIDLVCDAERAYAVFNGRPEMSSVTGTGCQLSALICSYLAANPEKTLEASLAAVCAMGLAGEKAYSRLTELEGNASYRNYIIDAIYRMSGEALEAGARIRVIS